MGMENWEEPTQRRVLLHLNRSQDQFYFYLVPNQTQQRRLEEISGIKESMTKHSKHIIQTMINPPSTDEKQIYKKVKRII